MDPNGDGYIGVTLHPDLKPYLETQLLSIKPDRTVKITLMAYHDQPFEEKIDSVAWGILVQDGSGGTSTGLLAAVNQTVDWVRLPQRFPVRVQITAFFASVPCP